METYDSILKILGTISSAEEELENYRQLLNEEITFNLTDLTIAINRGNSVTNAIILSHFLNSGSDSQRELNISQNALESVIRFYNENSSLNMTFVEFSSLFLSRENKLLSKMVLERPDMGAIPGYLLNFARKIVLCEARLHQTLIQFRILYGNCIQDWLKEIMEGNLEAFVDESKLKAFCGEDLNFQLLVRYLKAISNTKIPLDYLRTVLTLKNSNLVANFLKSKQLQSSNSEKIFRPQKIDPYIRPEFHDCLERPKLIDNFSYREIKSIEKHLNRLNSSNKLELTQKIVHYRTFVQKQVRKVCKALKQLILIEKQTEYARIELCLCADFYPILFFNSFDLDRSQRIIPSSFQDYFKALGSPLPLKKIYLLFKRFSSHEDGKMSFNSFCSIFDVCSSNSIYTRIDKNRKVKSLDDISVDSKRTFLQTLTITAENEYRCEKIKHNLLKNRLVNLRDVFSCIDTDEDGSIDQLDFRMVWKRFLGLEISNQELDLIWFRIKGRAKGYSRQTVAVVEELEKQEDGTLETFNVGRKGNKLRMAKGRQTIRYEEFIQELSPRISLRK